MGTMGRSAATNVLMRGENGIILDYPVLSLELLYLIEIVCKEIRDEVS